MFIHHRSVFTKYNANSLVSSKYDELNDSLSKKLEEQPYAEYMSNSLYFPQRSSPDKKSYAQDLLQQIADKQKKIQTERAENSLPAISEAFHGYPNLPQTPQQLRRQREKAKMLKVKEDLELQMRSKSDQVKRHKEEELEVERLKNESVLRKLQEEKKLSQSKKQLEREELTNFWQKASKTRDLMYQIREFESKGFNPRSRSEYIKKAAEEIVHEEEKVEKSVETLNDDCVKSRRRFSYMKRAAKIQSELEVKNRSSYQFKLKKLLESAKKNRLVSMSLNPSQFNARKRLF